MSDEAKDRALFRVAQAISDGQPVDWEAEQSAHQGLETRLQSLRVLEAVATAHGATPGGHEGGPAPALAATSTALTPNTLTATDSRAGAGPEAPLPASWGPLAIRERLGQGGFGEVYRAYDPSMQRDVALKLLRPGEGRRDPSTARLLDEARRLARVRHPNVLVVHGADEHDGRAGIWADLVRGRTLEQSLSEQGPLGAHEACLIGIDLCGALAAVHAAGLVHRDVKTSNVMREQGGRIVLMDFGSVLEQVRADERSLPETTSGTPLFMAPEQLAGGNATASTDLYSLGVLLYRLVTCRFPVEAASLSELRGKHRKGERVPLRDHRPDLPAGFVGVVERAIAPEAGRRYASAGALEQALTGALGLVVPEGVVAATRPGRVSPRRAIGFSLASVAALVVGAMVLYPVLRPGPFSAEAALFRVANGSEERLAPGALVHPGDHLILEISAAEPFYTYVLSEDENGEVYRLFPAGMDLKNPLPPRIRHRLPGKESGKQMTWEITSAGGTEQLLAIASRTPQVDVESELASLPKAEAGRQVSYAPLSQRTLTVLRGIGGLAEEDAPPGGGAAHNDVLADITQNLQAHGKGREDVWTWRIDLRNPGQ